MDSLDYYRGKEIVRVVEGSGRRPTTLHYLIAAFMLANDETWTIEQMVKMLYEINAFQPEPINKAKTMQELGY